jgi:hypothetical protein
MSLDDPKTLPVPNKRIFPTDGIEAGVGQAEGIGDRSDDVGYLLQLADGNVSRSSGIGFFDHRQSPPLAGPEIDLSPINSLYLLGKRAGL